MANSQPASTPVSTEQSPPIAPAEPYSAFFSKRSQRQLSLFAAGAGFFVVSSLITRRSIVRRYRLTQPKFFQPSNHTNHNINGAMEAFEALNIATINVVSVGMMATGGMLWALDVSSLDDIRKRVQKNMVGGKLKDGEEEQEIEEFFKSVLARKEFKALRGDYNVEKETKEKEDAEKLEEDEKKD